MHSPGVKKGLGVRGLGFRVEGAWMRVRIAKVIVLMLG